MDPASLPPPLATLVDHITSLYPPFIASLRLASAASLAPSDAAPALLAQAAALLRASPSLNVRAYRTMLPKPDADDGWAASTETSAATTTVDLDRRIAIESSANIRDQQRVSGPRAQRPPVRPLCAPPPNPANPRAVSSPQRVHLEAGRHAALRGDYVAAVRYFGKAREFCADNVQTATVTLQLLEWAVVGRDWGAVWRNVDGAGMALLRDALPPLCVCPPPPARARPPPPPPTPPPPSLTLAPLLRHRHHHHHHPPPPPGRARARAWRWGCTSCRRATTSAPATRCAACRWPWARASRPCTWRARARSRWPAGWPASRARSCAACAQKTPR